jgi:hypothetical protein
LDIERLDLPFIVGDARADGYYFTLLWLFLSRVWDNDAASGPLVLIDPAHDHAVMQWTKLHLALSSRKIVRKIIVNRGCYPRIGKPLAGM